MPRNQERSRLRLRDMRDLSMLVGECRALGGDGIRWRQLLVTRIRKLLDADMAYLDADMAYFVDGLVYSEQWSTDGWTRPLSIIDEWRQHFEEPQRFFWQFIRRGRAEGSPIETILTRAMASKSGIRAATRRDMIDDKAWYVNPLFQQEPAKLRMDDFVTGVIADNAPYSSEDEGKLGQMLFLQRAENREPFSKRDVRAIQVLLSELAKLQPQELTSVNDSAFITLPPRLLQVLACLLEGATVKEVAKKLGISAHTVQEHVKRLYKRSGTCNRNSTQGALLTRQAGQLLFAGIADSGPIECD